MEIIPGVCTGGSRASCFNCTVVTGWVMGSSYTETLEDDKCTVRKGRRNKKTSGRVSKLYLI